ncbi:hypothetical protein ABZ372_40865, partial [Streptomyces sp. NPDC005921]
RPEAGSMPAAVKPVPPQKRPPSSVTHPEVWADVELLCAGPHNLGALYLLPEVRAERFAGFRAVRSELKDAYRQLIAATDAGGALGKGELELRTDLVFGLIESVILVHRSEPERPVGEFARAAADAALRIAGV